MTPVIRTYVLGALMLATLSWVFVVTFLMQASIVLYWIGLFVGFMFVLAGGVLALRASPTAARLRGVDVLVSLVATAATLFLVRQLHVPAFVAAALIATSLGIAMLSGGPLDTVSGTAGYTGGFVGLVAPNITISLWWVLLAGALAGALWSLIATSAFQGCGGRMGTTAFMASIGVYLVATLLGNRGGAVLLPPVNGLAHWAVVPVGCLAAVVTWMLMYRLGWSLPMASGLTSLLVCGGLALWGPPSLQLTLAASWYGGTAVGRTDSGRLPNAAWIALAGLAYGSLMLRFGGPLQGHVGVIGATGLMGVLAVVALRRGLQSLAARLPGKPRVA